MLRSLHLAAGCDYICNMNIAFIPAKGTSSRIPKKNLQTLAGLSLTRITLDFAENLDFFDYIYLSTDSKEIVASATDSRLFDDIFVNSDKGSVFHASKNLYIHKRRDGDSKESARTIDPLLDCLKIGMHTTGILTILQPTSPFRTRSEYREMVRRFHAGTANSMFSIKEIQGLHPLKSFQVKSDGELLLTDGQFDYLTTPVQELPQFYAADGAYYITKIDYLLAYKEILAKQTMTYLRKGICTLNIDTLEELETARRATKTTLNTNGAVS
jgi:CMP-N-acetylneuraminic acid synthetase